MPSICAESGGEVRSVYNQKVDGAGLIRFDAHIGKTINLHCTAVGKALLAFARNEAWRTKAHNSMSEQLMVGAGAAEITPPLRSPRSGGQLNCTSDPKATICASKRAGVLSMAGEPFSAIGLPIGNNRLFHIR